MGQNKVLHILIIIGIVIVYGITVHAEDNLTLEILGKTMTGLPYSVENGELLVPARVLVEELGGKVVWQELLKVILAVFDDGVEIKLQVGQMVAQIQPGGEVKQLVTPPRQIQGQTLIPVRFLAHQLGYFFKWDAQTKRARIYKPDNWVQGLRFVESLSGDQLVISSTKKVTYKTCILSEPDRLVIDLHDSALSAKATNLNTEYYAFKNVKIAQYNAEIVRIVVYLHNHIQYKVVDEMGNDGYKVKVSFAIGVREVLQTEQGILIRSSGEIGDYKIYEYPNPERLVIDIPEQTLQLPMTTIPVKHPLVQQVRASQHSWEPKVVRLVLDLNEKIEYNILRGKTASEIIIQPKVKANTPESPKDSGGKEPVTPTKPVENSPIVQPGKPDGQGQPPAGQKPAEPVVTKPQVPEQQGNGEIILGTVGKEYGDNELVSIGVMPGNNRRVLLYTSTPATYSVTYLPEPSRLVVDVEGVTTRLPAKLSGDNSDILGVRLHQYDKKVRVVFDLKKYDKHKILSEKRTQKVDISFGSNPLQGRVIVIDPGHGGSDPGAIGPSGSHEKTINLAISLQVVKLLREAGATVVMTRDSDVYPTLSERVDLANQLNAEIFVSIHCNSLMRIDPGGTETFVSPKSQDSRPLAKAIQTNLVKAIGLYDRGVKSNEFHVLVNTTMPAVLVEVAFISKQDEEKLLMTSDYQNKAARGIYDGIVAYFAQINERSGVGQ